MEKEVIIVSPPMDSKRNFGGISSLVKLIIDKNKCCKYIVFIQGNSSKYGTGLHVFRRLKELASSFIKWRKLLRRYPAALVHYNFPLTQLSILRDTPFILFACKSHRTVVHLHGGRFMSSPQIPFPLKWLSERVFKSDASFIALSDKEHDIVVNVFHARNVYVLPNVVEIGDAQKNPHIHIDNEPLTLGYLGRITDTKGMDFLLDACSKLRLQGFPFKLRIAGIELKKGQYLPLFLDKLQDQFEYCGVVSGDSKNTFLRSLDVFVLPSFFEGLPMSMLESMAYGAIPVVTPVGSILSVVKNQKNGLIIDVRDSQSIVNAITKLSNDKVLFEMLSMNARRTVFDNFNPEQYVKRLNRIYKHTLLSPPTPTHSPMSKKNR